MHVLSPTLLWLKAFNFNYHYNILDKVKAYTYIIFNTLLLISFSGQVFATGIMQQTISQQCNANTIALPLQSASVAQPASVKLSYQLVAKYPHDPKAFTEGLLFHAGYLFESIGLLGASELRKVDLYTGKVIRSRRPADIFFAEGLSLFNGELIQLSWKLGIAYVYQTDNLNLVRKFNYSGEGWGATTLGEQLIISNGSSQLQFFDPQNANPLKSLQVSDQGQKISGLNELELADGLLYANIWLSPCIVQIDPTNGRVLGWLNLSSLSPLADNGWETAMNGIAYDPEKKHFFITGKHWPDLYEIKIISPATNGKNNLQ